MRHRFAFRIAFAITCLCLTTLPGSAAAQVLWSNPWTFQSPLQLGWSTPSITFTQEGGAILAAASHSSMDLQTMRIDSSGARQWSASLYSYWGIYDELAGSPIELEDGGAIVSVISAGLGHITRLNSSGQILWTRQAPLSWLSRLGTNQIAFAGCNVLSVADLQTGNVVWQRSFDAPRTCWPVSGTVDSGGNIYATFAIKVGNSPTGYRVEKFQSDGTSVWNVVVAANGNESVIGTDGSILYLESDSELQALHADNGSIVWNTPIDWRANVVLSADAPVEPIIRYSGSLRRLNGQSGSDRWNVAVANCNLCAPPYVTADSLVIVDGANLERLDSSNGASIWSAPLPATGSNGGALRWHAFGGLTGNQILGIADEYSGGTPAHIQPFDFRNGDALPSNPSPTLVMGAYKGDSRVDGDDVFDLAIGPDATANRIRLRRTNATTGAVIWENSAAHLAEPYASPGYHLSWTWYVPAIGVDTVVSATDWGYAIFNGGIGLAYVSAHERSNGSQRWERVLTEPGQRLTYVSEPLLDQDDNVFVATGARMWCAPEEYCARQVLYKLSAATGEILWSFDGSNPAAAPLRGGSNGQVFPRHFDLVNGDVIVLGGFDGEPHTMVRLSGSDGSLMWASDVLSGASGAGWFYRQDATHIIVISDDQQARLDLDTGVAIWTAMIQFPSCAGTCHQNDDLILPNGDQLSVGEGDSKLRIHRIHNDGSGTIETWIPQPNDPSLRSVASQVGTTPSGKVMLILSRYLRQTNAGLSILAGFDVDSGTLTSQQVRRSKAMDSTSEDLGSNLLSLPAENRLLFVVNEIGETQPLSNGSGLMDTTITANGDLTLSLTLDRTHVSVGQSLEFQIVASYAGDQPISGVRLQVGALSLGTFGPITCSTQSASNCVLDGRSGNVHAIFDIQPGGSIKISGQMPVLQDKETHYFGGVVWGPVGLNESDTVNNFSRVQIIQPLFADGFDSP